MRDWAVEWRGRSIVVNCSRSFLHSDESLSIDGRVVARHRAWLGFAVFMQTSVRIEDETYVIWAELAPTRKNRFGTACLIYADGRVIGGDAEADLVRDVYH